MAKRKLLSGDDSVRKTIEDLETHLKFVNLNQQKFRNMCVDPENWLPRPSKLENNLNLWKTRSLSMIGKILIINVLGASKFWFLTKVLPIPEWVVIRFKKLIFHFLWGSKIETVSRATLSTPLLEGGLGLIDIVAKSKALKLSTMFTTISRPHLSAFYLLKYFVVGKVQIRLGPLKG